MTRSSNDHDTEYKIEELILKVTDKELLKVTCEDVQSFTLHYAIFAEGNGFRFVASKMVTEDDDGKWYEIIAEGVAYFDGLRHLHLRQSNENPQWNGYHNYPDVCSYIALFTRLRELEVQYCSMLD